MAAKNRGSGEPAGGWTPDRAEWTWTPDGEVEGPEPLDAAFALLGDDYAAIRARVHAVLEDYRADHGSDPCIGRGRGAVEPSGEVPGR